MLELEIHEINIMVSFLFISNKSSSQRILYRQRPSNLFIGILLK